MEQDVYIHRGTIIEVGQGCQVLIGSGTHIQANCSLHSYVSNIKIGRHVMIAPHCGFFSYQHKTDDLSQPMCLQDFVTKGDILIADDVWLGTGAKVMDGVHIGQGAVIGAGAVVTHNIPPYSIAMGVPARVVCSRREKAPQDVQE
jgi:acetyltransferase-like isoleucine patch superfamily enzyme